MKRLGDGAADRVQGGLFDLELDKDKNQYETNAGSAAEQKQQQVDEALKKLEELARRQQQLAEQQKNNPQQLAQYRSGKDKLFGFFVGQAMKKTNGQANPQLLNDLLKQSLSHS